MISSLEEENGISTRSYSATQPSLKHPEHNEDRVLEIPELRVYGVFDGMGGLKDGELAAITATEACFMSLNHVRGDISKDYLSQAVDQARIKVLDATNNGDTTVLMISLTKDKVYSIHAGDSRLYRFRSGVLETLTVDHSNIRTTPSDPKKIQQIFSDATRRSEVPQALQHLYDKRNVVYEYLTSNNPETNVYDNELGDVYILTTDGVHDNLTDRELAILIRDSLNTGEDPAENIVQEAKRVSSGNSFRSKRDDITCIVVVNDAKPQRAVVSIINHENSSYQNPVDLRFNTLYKNLLERGDIEGSAQTYSPQTLINLITNVRAGKQDIRTITRTAGLREHVEQLLLLDHIYKKGSIRGSDGYLFTPDELVDITEKIITQRIPITSITRNGELRRMVEDFISGKRP